MNSHFGFAFVLPCFIFRLLLVDLFAVSQRYKVRHYWRYLMPSLTTWVWSPGTTWWKERSDLHKTSSDLYIHIITSWMHMPVRTRAHTHTHTHTHTQVFFKNFKFKKNKSQNGAGDMAAVRSSAVLVENPPMFKSITHLTAHNLL